ncbi:hypothetical protein MC885_018328 [Smutsia gigantea]|nr:hypothetical protein MC885_018328 [Smutsia gigantea]
MALLGAEAFQESETSGRGAAKEDLGGTKQNRRPRAVPCCWGVGALQSTEQGAAALSAGQGPASALPYQRYLQLLGSYFEAYQHVLDPEERFALARVITDVMHRHPPFDVSRPYVSTAYQDKYACLWLHLQPPQGILSQRMERQREYVQGLWREGRLDDGSNSGLPLDIIRKQLISVDSSRPSLKNIYLLEFHPSLGLLSLIPRAQEHLFQEPPHACRPTSASGLACLRRRMLRLAQDAWRLSPAKPGFQDSAQLQKHVGSLKLVVMGAPFLVGKVGLLALKSTAGEGQNRGQDSHVLLLETFSKLLELMTLRHRLTEMSPERIHLARSVRGLRTIWGETNHGAARL